MSDNILIIGAGLVGTLLAHQLANRGYAVTVVEKREDMRRADISAGRSINLALAERGREALRRAGQLSNIEARLVEMRGRLLHPLEGEPRFQAYGQHASEVIYSVSRGELNRTLISAAEDSGARIVFNASCEQIDLENRFVSIRMDDSNTLLKWSFDRVLGADGAGSVVREAILSASRQVGVLEEMDHAYKELSISPAEDGSFRMDPHALHIWPRGGFMLIALPNPDHSFTLTLFLPREGERNSFAGLQTPSHVRAFFEEQFPDITPWLTNLTSEFATNPTGKLATLRCWPWHDGERALILGDAAHAIVPFHGQGMNCGFEDCDVLLELIDQSGHDWKQVIPEFCRLRKPNADAIADLALKNYLVMRDQVRDTTFALRQQVEFELERRWPQQYIPKYAMVMFHRIPYAVALERGAAQEEFVAQLMASAQSLQDIDFARADAWIQTHLSRPPGLADWKVAQSRL
jgi:kynurenine 3-monooxygenase